MTKQTVLYDGECPMCVFQMKALSWLDWRGALALVLWLPGVILLAEIIYRWVSRHRLLFSRLFGCKDACALLPARKREQDKLA